MGFTLLVSLPTGVAISLQSYGEASLSQSVQDWVFCLNFGGTECPSPHPLSPGSVVSAVLWVDAAGIVALFVSRNKSFNDFLPSN